MMPKTAKGRRGRGSITIRDIAREAGVSPSTAARVLAGSPNVTAAHRAAVLRVAERLDYRPNVLARQLASGRSGAIGVLVQDLSNPFYSLVVRGIEMGLQGSGHYPLFANCGDHREVEHALSLLLSHRVDGLVVLGGQSGEDELRRLAERLPLVFVSRSIAGLEDRSVDIANLRGAHEATRHLVALGHRRIAHVSGPAWHRHAIDRRSGYEQALAQAGIELDPSLVVEGDFEEASGAQAVDALLGARLEFTALFAANDQMAMGAMAALTRYGLRVPADVSVVGFDDLRFAAFLAPPLTTVRQPALQIGLAAAQAAARLLAGEPPRLPSFATELVLRQSTAPPRRKPRAGKARRASAHAPGLG
jgi:LacI family transcriptional regulator